MSNEIDFENLVEEFTLILHESVKISNEEISKRPISIWPRLELKYQRARKSILERN